MVLSGLKNTSQFNEDFTKNYNEDSYTGYCFEVDVQYLEELYDLWNHLPSLVVRMKIQKVEKLITCYRHNKFKASAELWINIEKRAITEESLNLI